jgi:anthranilate phosphoribosyltransferase
MDEITTTGRTAVCELDRGTVRSHVFHPEDFGLRVSRLHELRGTTAGENAEFILDLLRGRTGAKRDIVLLNAGAALYLAGVAATVQEGITKAAQTIDEGKAFEKLRHLIEFTRRVQPEADR